jgi:hypothetical protein
VPVQSARFCENSEYEFSEELESGSERSGARGRAHRGWEKDNAIIFRRATARVFIQDRYILKKTRINEINRSRSIKATGAMLE